MVIKFLQQIKNPIFDVLLEFDVETLGNVKVMASNF